MSDTERVELPWENTVRVDHDPAFPGMSAVTRYQDKCSGVHGDFFNILWAACHSAQLLGLPLILTDGTACFCLLELLGELQKERGERDKRTDDEIVRLHDEISRLHDLLVEARLSKVTP